MDRASLSAAPQSTATVGGTKSAEDVIIDALLSAKLSVDAHARLQALLDGLAAEFDMPFCLISFVHSSKSLIPFRHGVDAESFEHPVLGVSFCQHVQSVKRPLPLIVLDAAADDRFQNHPLVAGPPCVRTYLGAPVRWLDGSYLGTVCLLDTRPKTAMSCDECAPLMRAAEQVMREYARGCDRSPPGTMELSAHSPGLGWQ